MIRISLKYSCFLFIAILFGCAYLPDKQVMKVDARGRQDYHEAKEACRGGRFGSTGVKHASYTECMRNKGWRA